MVGEAHAQWKLTEGSRSCLQRLCAQGAHTLQWRDRGDKMLAAWEMQVPASSAGAVCPWLGTLTPCSGSLRCLGATYLGGRLGNPLTSLQRLQCLEVGSWGVGSPSFCCQGCASLVGYMCI